MGNAPDCGYMAHVPVKVRFWSAYFQNNEGTSLRELQCYYLVKRRNKFKKQATD